MKRKVQKSRDINQEFWPFSCVHQIFVFNQIIMKIDIHVKHIYLLV